MNFLSCNGSYIYFDNNLKILSSVSPGYTDFPFCYITTLEKTMQAADESLNVWKQKLFDSDVFIIQFVIKVQQVLNKLKNTRYNSFRCCCNS